MRTTDDLPLDLEVGEVATLPFTLHVPLKKTLKMEAAFLMPSEDGRTFFHIEKVHFGPKNEQGENVLCTGIDMAKAYDTEYQQTSNISDFGEVRLVSKTGLTSPSQVFQPV